MRRFFFTAVVVCVFSCFTSAQQIFPQQGFRLKTRNAADLYADQRRTVGNWCRQDFEGLRLSPDGWDRFKPLTTLKSNPDFATVTIVSRFQAEPRESIAWDLNVTYTIIGRYDRNEGYTADPGSQAVTFQTKDVDGTILITSLDPNSPHVSKKAAIDWMKKQLETASDVEKFHLREALKQLEPSPVAQDVPAK